MSEPITLTVVGIPASQGSKSRMPNGQMVEGSTAKARAALTAWRKAVADEARRWLEAHPQPPLHEPLSLDVTFRFTPVKSDPYRSLHSTFPDASKCLRATEDALTQSGLIADDRLLWRVSVAKLYCPPGESTGCTLVIERFGAVEAERREQMKAEAAQARRRARAAS